MATLILARRDVSALLSLGNCIDAVEEAFRAQGAGEAPSPGALGHHLPGGAFHIKAASLGGSRPYFAAKVNGNFFANPGLGLPRIQGALVLCDARHGTPLALMDSIEITTLRTAAATAVAVKYLAAQDAKTLTIVGCGVQGRAHLRALACVRKIRIARLYDTDRATADRLAAELTGEVDAEFVPADDLRSACRESEIVVACTPSRAPIIGVEDVSPGAFVAGVGADSEEKQELDSRLLASGIVITDATAQCAAFGDLRYAVRDGLMSVTDVYAELPAIVAGTAANPHTAGKTIVFDSTGTAIQDVAAASIVYERALEHGRGHRIELAG